MIHGEIFYDAMANGDCGLFQECPKAKKSKTNIEEYTVDPPSQWDRLPEDMLREIFAYLSDEDVLKASSVCISWRHGLYYPRYWRNITFPIYRSSLPKAQYFRLSGSQVVVNATIQFDALDAQCMSEVFSLLQALTTNRRLRSLILEPSHCHFNYSKENSQMATGSIDLMVSHLAQIVSTNPIQKLSFGLCEELHQHCDRILRLLGKNQPSDVLSLGLGSVKDDPSNYLITIFDVDLMSPFRNLQILSIDYDVLSNKLLGSLASAPKLRRLCVQVHGIWDCHAGTSDNAWLDFCSTNPLCELYLSLIHAYDEVSVLHDVILRKNMPLASLKVLFCENMNIDAIIKLENYKDTLRSLAWVDSHNADEHSYSNAFITYERNSQVPNSTIIDPLIIIAWGCKKLEELTLIGYNYHAINWVGVARLRCETLKVMQFVEEDVVYSDSGVHNYLLEHWAPLKLQDLHPVLTDPNAGDSDEYIMPLLHADLHAL